MAEKKVNTMPLVSVITPCYNQASYLEESIKSFLNQTYSNSECIIINDGSTDNTEEIALKLKLKDNRIKYLYQDHKGVSTARNNAIKNSKGKYLLPLDADDLISPTYVKECVSILENKEDVKIVYCEAEKFGEQIGIWDSRKFDIHIMAYENMIFSTAMFRKTDWAKTGGYEDFLVVGEDWELWINILKTGGAVVKLPFTGFFYRVHDKSKIRTYNWESSEYLEFIYKKHLDFFLKYLGNPITLYIENQKNKVAINKFRSTFIYIVYSFLKRVKSKITNKSEDRSHNPVFEKKERSN
jgi:glycosyltransferase involved in cell wall biosynthesis